LTDLIDSDPIFHLAESARLALLKTCQVFETTEQSSTLARIGFSRKAARVAANSAINGRVIDGFDQLSEYISNLETTWRNSQGKVRGAIDHVKDSISN
jgi:selenocysteine-specific translation elongation factor